MVAAGAEFDILTTRHVVEQLWRQTQVAIATGRIHHASDWTIWVSGEFCYSHVVLAQTIIEASKVGFTNTTNFTESP